MEIDYSRYKDFPFRPGAAALLVIDMQDYFTNKGSHAFIPASIPIIPRVNKLIAAFKGAGRPVIFTRHIDTDPANLMSRWWNDRIEESDPMSRLNAELDTGYGTIIVKHQYDAFLKTGLEEMLRRSKTGQVVITGVVTHICCETTARSAFMRDFETFIATDCTASYDSDHHAAAIFNLAHAFAVPVEHDVLLKGF